MGALSPSVGTSDSSQTLRDGSREQRFTLPPGAAAAAAAAAPRLSKNFEAWILGKVVPLVFLRIAVFVCHQLHPFFSLYQPPRLFVFFIHFHLPPHLFFYFILPPLTASSTALAPFHPSGPLYSSHLLDRRLLLMCQS